MTQTYDIINATASALSNVNGGGDDVPAYSLGASIALTDAEADTLMGTAGVLLVKASSTQEQRRRASKILRLGKDPSTATT